MDTATINVLFVVVAVLVIAGLVTWIVIVVRRASRITRTGDARLAAELQSAVRNPPAAANPSVDVAPVAVPSVMGPFDPVLPVMGGASDAVATPSVSPVPDAAPVDGVEARLTRLDGLHARGVITDRELAEARAKILAE
jgi:hypothetical protein